MIDISLRLDLSHEIMIVCVGAALGLIWAGTVVQLSVSTDLVSALPEVDEAGGRLHCIQKANFKEKNNEDINPIH